MIAIIVTVMVVILIIFYLFPIIQVCGDSMSPTYKDKEYLIGCRIHTKPKVGEVYVFKSPERNACVIKRISMIDTRGKKPQYYVLGDNSRVSNDSRYYGYLSSRSLVCKIIKQRHKEE